MEAKIKEIQDNQVKDQTELNSIVERLKAVETRLELAEKFQERSQINQNRLNGILNEVRKKMEANVYTTHKIRVEQYAIKKGLKQMDFAVSQLPYLMIDELHEQDLQKYYLIIRDCQTYKTFPMTNGQPDFKKYVAKTIQSFYSNFDERKIAHCEFIKLNQWERKQEPVKFRIKAKFHDQVTPMTIRNIALSKNNYRFRLGQTKRKRQYRYKRVQEAEKMNEQLDENSTWHFRVVQGTRIAKVDKKTGDFLEGQNLDDKLEYEYNRIKDFRLDMSLYNGVNGRPQIEDSEDDEDYTATAMDIDEQSNLDSVVEVLQSEITQLPEDTQTPEFDPLLHGNTMLADQQGAGSAMASTPFPDRENLDDIRLTPFSTSTPFHATPVGEDGSDTTETDTETLSQSFPESQPKSTSESESGYSTQVRRSSRSSSASTQKTNITTQSEGSTKTNAKRTRRAKKLTQKQETLQDLQCAGFETTSSNYDNVKEKRQNKTTKRKQDQMDKSESAITLAKTGKKGSGSPKSKIQKVATGAFNPATFEQTGSSTNSKPTTRNKQNNGATASGNDQGPSRKRGGAPSTRGSKTAASKTSNEILDRVLLEGPSKAVAKAIRGRGKK